MGLEWGQNGDRMGLEGAYPALPRTVVPPKVSLGDRRTHVFNTKATHLTQKATYLTQKATYLTQKATYLTQKATYLTQKATYYTEGDRG